MHAIPVVIDLQLSQDLIARSVKGRIRLKGDESSQEDDWFDFQHDSGSQYSGRTLKHAWELPRMQGDRAIAVLEVLVGVDRNWIFTDFVQFEVLRTNSLLFPYKGEYLACANYLQTFHRRHNWKEHPLCTRRLGTNSQEWRFRFF